MWLGSLFDNSGVRLGDESLLLAGSWYGASISSSSSSAVDGILVGDAGARFTFAEVDTFSSV